MKRFLIIVFFLILINIVYANNVDKEIENSLDHNDEVDVIVYLREPSEKHLDYEKVNLRKNTIKSLNNDFKLKYEYGSLNGFSGKINKNGLAKLKNDPNVKAAYLSKTRHIFLQDSLPLINATIVHNKLINNLNLTGKGQTICILDTGINYSHNDFGSCNSIGNGTNCRVVSGYDYVKNDSDPYDDHGHGTHVAGIAAASGGIKGVAPESNLVIIKVCDSSGVCDDNNIIAGIDFCNNNRTKYNISVISMSLGSLKLFSNYCDEGDPLTPSINIATGNNITVTAATGNDGNNAQIASPACIENATSVAWSTKQDLISDFSNRNIITDVIAPGGNLLGSGSCSATSTDPNRICSTSISGNYVSMSGTSMATPHVAGIVALLQQYKKEESNRVLTQAEVEKALKSTDKNITDSNGLNYTRVNANKALISIDTLKPTFTIVISPDKTNSSQNNVSINFTGFDTNLEKIIVNVSYPNGTLITSNESNFTISALQLDTVGHYNITVFVNDSNSNFNLSYYDLQVNNDLPFVTLNYPFDNLNTSSNLINFNCSATDDINLANLTLYINLNGNFTANKTTILTGKSNSTKFTLNLDDNIYIWNCLAYDNSNNKTFSQNNFTFRIDTLKPIITDVSSQVTTNSAIITWLTNEIANSTIYYGITETNLKQLDNNFIISHSITLNPLNANTLYHYNISSCDLVNNCNTGMQFSFTTNAETSTNPGGPGGGSSSGGGGSGSTIINTSQLNQNTIVNITENITSNTTSNLSNKEIENKEISEIKDNQNNELNQEKEKNPNLIKRIANILTGKTTFTGEAVNQGGRIAFTTVLINLLLLIIIIGIIVLIIYKIFFKKY